MVDFGALRKQEKKGAPVEPRQLYGLLPKKLRGRGQLWDAQAQVLNEWYERRAESDLVIKLNTGGGKTTAGLILLQSVLNAKQGPALYVAPSNYLVEQVVKEAEALGLATTKNVDSAAYLQGIAIGIVNVHKLVNGRSVFSENRSAKPPVPIGTVVIDDAHAAIATSREQLSLELEADTQSYRDLLDLFGEDLRKVSPDGYLDLREGVRGKPVRVPFWSWQDRLDEVRTILRKESQESRPLYYSWPAMRDTLDLGRAVFGSDRLTITAPCPPIAHITSLREAKHRVFLTATLADDSILVTDFDAHPDGVRAPISPVTAGDIGERMILSPQEINSSITAEEIRSEIVKLSHKHNTVVLVPSAKWAKIWEEDAAIVADASSVEDAVEQLKSGNHVGLVVLANKYDGIDLPHDACRVLVVDGLPESFSPDEKLQSMLRGSSTGVDDRQVQRIEQGMGRGIRSNEDYCVVFLIGPRLSQLTVDPRSLPRFSPATRTQLATSREVATAMENATLKSIIRTANQALERDIEWVEFAKERLGEVEARSSGFSESAIAERKAFDSARHGDCYSAAEVLLEAANSQSADERTKGALFEQAAVYMNKVDHVRSQQILTIARGHNPYTLRPLEGLHYTKLEQSIPQAKLSTDRLMTQYTSPAQLKLSFESIVDDLEFDPDRTEQFEEALFEAGRLIGIGSQRPEHEIGQGPDNLFALPDGQFWVIEAKTGATSVAIGKRDMGQLGQSLLWFKKHYDPSVVPVPVMVHPATSAYKDATVPEGMRIITKSRLGKFAHSLQAFSTGLAQQGWDDPVVVGRLLAGSNLLGEDLQSNFTQEQRGAR